MKKYDSEYLGDEPGLYPDILAPFEGGVQMILEQWRALWVDCEIPEDAEGGDHDITIVFAGTDGTEYVRTRLTLHVVPAVLPNKRFSIQNGSIRTAWLTIMAATYFQRSIGRLSETLCEPLRRGESI